MTAFRIYIHIIIHILLLLKAPPSPLSIHSINDIVISGKIVMSQAKDSLLIHINSIHIHLKEIGSRGKISYRVNRIFHLSWRPNWEKVLLLWEARHQILLYQNETQKPHHQLCMGKLVFKNMRTHCSMMPTDEEVGINSKNSKENNVQLMEQSTDSKFIDYVAINLLMLQMQSSCRKRQD